MDELDTSVKAVLRILETVVATSELSPADTTLFSTVLDAIRHRENERMIVVADVFIDHWKRAIATNGQRSALYLIRDDRMRIHWKWLWRFIEGDMSSIEYRGTDSMQTYVLLRILQSSTSDLLVSVSNNVATSAVEAPIVDLSESSDFGIYASFLPPAAEQPTTSNPSSNSDNTNDNATASCSTIPTPLVARYRDQSKYVVVHGARLLKTTAKFSDQSAEILRMVEKLAPEEENSEGQRSIVPSPELLNILFMIHQLAIQMLSTTDGFDELLRALQANRSLLAVIRQVLISLSDTSSIDFASNFLEFVIEVSKRSILKTVVEFEHRNKSAATSMPFRMNVQAREMNS